MNTIKDNPTVIRHELYRIALGLWDYVKNSGRYPESANWTLDWIGAVPGKRESRRFVGPHMLNQQDILEARQHPDEVAYGGWTIDLHPVKGIDAIDEPPCSQTRVPKVYGIPLRCYFSRNVENLFFAGRDISATHVGFASTRVMATCAIGGEAVGFAAAQCVKEGTTPSQIVADPKRLYRLQQTMLRNDMTLLNTKVDPAGNHVMSAEISASSTAANTSAENVRDGQTRDEIDSKTAELIRSHGWRSAAMTAGQPQWIELRWPQPVEIRELHLWFDSGFTRELILSPSNWATAHCIRGPQPELVKDYTIEVNGDKAVTVAGNHERKRVHRFEKPVMVRSLRLNVTATQGAEEARVFEIRAY